MEELRLRRVSRTRLVLESAPAPVEEPLRASRDDDDIPMRVPLEHYSPAEYGKAPLLLVLVLIGAAFAIYRDPTLLRRGYAAGVSQLHNFGSMTSAGQSALEGTSSPPPVNRPEQTASGRSQSAENGSNSSNGRRSTTDRVLGQVEAALTDGSSSIETAGAVKVNPSVMDENLIVQRVPAYPEGAKISGVEGDVVMQALISKEGTVKRVHVVAGDSRLRSAAEEAVYKWRYRPYVLNGQPVEVATTVTVNFNLDR
jgi:TonB family protein